jgi:hypothetical protein
LGRDRDGMVFEIDQCFEALENNSDEIWKITDELMEIQKKMYSMMEYMWKFLKFGVNMHVSTSTLEGRKNIVVQKIEQDVGSMGEVCSFF